MKERCEQAGVSATVIVTQTSGDLPAAVAALRQSGVDALLVCGGDGTLLATVDAAIAVYGAELPALLVLPGGTMNTVARNLGVRGKPEAVLDRLLSSWRAGGQKGLGEVPRRPQEVMRVVTKGEQSDRPAPAGSKDATSCTRYGCIFSAAMGARYLTAYARHPSLAWAAWLGLRTVGSSLIPSGGAFARWLFERTPAELSIDGERASETAFRLVICATVPDVGLGMRVPWQAGSVAGRFALIASSLPILQNVLQIGRMQRGEPLRGEPHIDRLAQAVSLRFPSPQPLTLDGELFSARGVDLSLGPSLQFLIPT
jgi:diacylglycerol kinase family enzyme